MKKKLFSVVASIAMSFMLFADNMFVKLKDGNVVEYKIDDVEEVFFAAPSIDPSIPVVDSLIVDASKFPLKFEKLTDSTAKVSGYDSDYFLENGLISIDMEIPSKVLLGGKVYVVTEIGMQALAGCQFLRNVVVPSTVTNIQAEGFRECSNLKTVLLPTEVSLGYGAFSTCGNLESVEIPSGAFIGRESFYSCTALKELKIDSGVTSIDKNAFNECISLTNVFIPSTVKYIRKGAFYGCKNLYVIVDNSKENIIFDEDQIPGWFFNPFEGCKSVKYLRDIDDSDIVDVESSFCKILSDSTVELITFSFESDSAVVPSKVRFGGNVYDVVSIADMAFYSYPGLKSVTIPSSVVNIGETAFFGCKDLDIVVDNSKANVKLGDFAFGGCKSVNFIKDNFVRDSSSVDALLLPLKFNVISDSTVEVSAVQFYINSIVIPSKVQIDDHVYSVTQIGRNAFGSWLNVKSVTLPSTLTNIDVLAFSGCTKLESVVFTSNEVNIGSNAFEHCSSLVDIQFPNVVGIDNEAFMGCSNLKSLVIPSGAIIGQKAFMDCHSLTDLEIQSGVEYIGKKAFMGCENLLSVNIPSTVTTIREGAFYGCAKLDVVIDNTEDGLYVEEYAFTGCKSVEYKK